MRLSLNHINRVAVIMYYGRSGSVFLHSLLDFHPNIITIPGTYLSGFNDFWILESSGLSKDQIIAAFVKRYDVLFDANSPVYIYGAGANAGVELGFANMGHGQNETISVDKDTFIFNLNQVLNDCEKINRKNFFKAIHIAYYHCLNESYDSLHEPLIIYQLHTPSQVRAIQLLEDFPFSIYLHTVRSPIQTFSSHIIHVAKKMLSKSDLTGLINHCLYGGFPVFEDCREYSWAVKLEDLHQRPRTIMESICKVLDIPWNDSLMHSTFNGKPWYNVKDSVKINGFSDKTIIKTNDEALSSFDRFRLDVVLSRKHDAWEYPVLPWSDYRLMKELLDYPFKFEELVTLENEKEKIELRRSVKSMFCDYWEEVNFGDKKTKEIKLLRPATELAK